MFWQTKGGWKTLWVMLEPLNIFEPSLRPRFVPAWWTWSSSTTSSSQPTTQRCSKFTCQKILVHKDDSTSYPKVISGFRLLTLFMVFIPTFKHMGNVSKWGVLYSPESNHFGTTKGHLILKHAHSYIIYFILVNLIVGLPWIPTMFYPSLHLWDQGGWLSRSCAASSWGGAHVCTGPDDFPSRNGLRICLCSLEGQRWPRQNGSVEEVGVQTTQNHSNYFYFLHCWVHHC